MSQTYPGQKAATGAPAPKSQQTSGTGGIRAEDLESRIDHFLAGRGLAGAPRATPQPIGEVPADFVCEDDVRQAIQAGRKLLIGEKTILTPSARDLGESEKVFVHAV